MKISRRNFLAAATMAAGALAPLRALGRASGKDDVLAGLGFDAFYPYVTTDFEFRGYACGTFTMKLTGMRELGQPNAKQTGDRNCFALFFDGKAIAGAGQDTYRVEHFALGAFDLFVTAVTGADRQMHMTAVINRI